VKWTGDYAAMFRILAAVIAVLAVAALVAPEPAPFETAQTARD